jgi:signal transduction histidine kinase
VAQAADGVWRLAPDGAHRAEGATAALGPAGRTVLAVQPAAAGGARLLTSWGPRPWSRDVAPTPAETAQDFLSTQRFVTACAIDDTHFAFGSRDRGVTILNAAGEVSKQIDADLLGSLAVNALAMDRDGALWVALENGVASVAPAREATPPKVVPLDGAGGRSPWGSGLPIIRSFPDAPGVSRNGGETILVSREGLVYVGNGNGLFEFDGVLWRKIPLPDLSVIYSLVADASGRVWYGGNNCFGVLEPDATGVLTAKARETRLPEADRGFGPLFRGIEYGGEIYFLAQTPGTLLCIDAQENAQVLRGTEVLSSVFVAEGAVRATGDKHAFVVRDGKLEPDPAADLLAKDAFGMVRASWPHSAGGTTMVTSRGLRRWVQGRIERSNGDIDRARARNQIAKATLLGGGLIAMGTAQAVIIADGDGNVLATYDEASGLGGTRIRALAGDPAGGLWVGHDTGVVRVQLDSPLRQQDARIGLRGTVRDATLHRGQLYAATTQGLFVREQADGRFRQIDEVQSNPYAVISTEAGLFYAGASVRVLRDDGTITEIESSDDAVTNAYRLPRDPDRIVALSGVGLIVYQRTAAGWRREGLATSKVVRSLQQDAAGWLWGILEYDQVVRLDWRNGVRLDTPMELLGEAEGLPSFKKLRAYPRLALFDGQIEVCAAGGFFRYDATTHRFSPETRIAGFEPAEAHRAVFNLPGGALWMKENTPYRQSFVRPTGPGAWRVEREPYTGFEVALPVSFALDDPANKSLWVGLVGLVSYDLGRPRPQPALPAARVRQVSLAGDRVVWGGAGPAPALALAPEERFIRFDFAAPTYTIDLMGDSRTEYRTQLAGFDREWSGWSKESYRTYTNLPPGRLTFNVQARALPGLEGPVAGFSVRVIPPWWRTWWFAGLASLVGVGGVTGITRWLGNRALKRRIVLLEAQSAVERERLRLARDLHDEVGSGLGRIILFAGEAERARHNDASLGTALTRVRTAAHELVQHAREIVWAVSPQHDALTSVIERFGDYTEETLRAAGIACAVRRPAAEKIPPVVLGSEARHSLFLILKEAVHNCVKYAGPTSAELTLEIAGREFVLTLRDHGRGFAPGEQRGTGHGTKNIVARAEALGGRATVVGEPDRGTVVTVRVPLPPESGR